MEVASYTIVEYRVLSFHFDLTLNSCLQAAGLSDWIAVKLGPLEIVPPWLLMIVITLVVSILTEFMGNGLMSLVLTPVVASLVRTDQQHLSKFKTCCTLLHKIN